MKVYHSITEFERKKATVFTVGMYDGVHNGHREIIRQLKQIAKDNQAESCLLTFSPHPRFVLQKDCDLKLLTLEQEKIDILESLGLDHLVIHPFTKEFSRLTSIEFVRDVLVNKLGVSHFLVGHDHQFGRNREGDFEQLEQLAELYEFKVYQIAAIEEGEKPVSSTKIRNALWDGKIAYATEALGQPYQLTGKVVHGDGIGKKMGIPTINLSVDDKKLIPKSGVYGVKVYLGNETYNGLMNIGFRPTVDGKEKRIEVFVLNYSGDLYEKHVKIEILTYIREEEKFDSKEALVAQIQKDKVLFEGYLNAGK